MILLVSDANVFIDVEHGNLTSIIFRLPFEIIVPDVLFEMELKERHSHLLQAGLKVKSLTPEFIKRAEFLRYKYPKPGVMDHLALALALQERCSLLTGDKDLRSAAIIEGVEVHGTIWVVGKLLQGRIIEAAQARDSFNLMKAKGSRLPWINVEQLLNQFSESIEK